MVLWQPSWHLPLSLWKHAVLMEAAGFAWTPSKINADMQDHNMDCGPPWGVTRMAFQQGSLPYHPQIKSEGAWQAIYVSAMSNAEPYCRAW